MGSIGLLSQIVDSDSVQFDTQSGLCKLANTRERPSTQENTEGTLNKANRDPWRVNVLRPSTRYVKLQQNVTSLVDSFAALFTQHKIEYATAAAAMSMHDEVMILQS